MTLIENDSPKVQYTGPFIRGQLLPLTFPYIAKTDVKMLIDGVPAQLNLDFEIITEVSAEHPVAYPDSAYIKNALPDAKQITLYRVTPLDQQAPFPQNSKFRSERIEQALDKLTMQQQEQEEQLSRCIIAPITLETFNGQLPAPAADQALKWNTDGTELENYDIIGEQEAFEAEVNETFSVLENNINNQFAEFEQETNEKIDTFEGHINEVLEDVLRAAEQLDQLDEHVQAAETAAITATGAADGAAESAINAQEAAQAAQDSYDQFKQEVDEVLATIDTKSEETLTNISNTEAGILSTIESLATEEQEEIRSLVESGKEEIQEAIGDVKVLTTLKIGQIGIAPLGIDETLNMERYLNGQIIIQDQFEVFTSTIKKRIALYPSIACTEEEWQTIVANSDFAQCGKFVIDDNAGTIRLPKVVNIQGLTDLSKLGEIVKAGLPTHTHTRGTMNITGTLGYEQEHSFYVDGCVYFGGANAKRGSFDGSNTGTPARFDASRSWTGSTSTGNYSKALATTNTVQQEQIQYPYFIQVATGAEVEDNIINEIELNNPFSLLDYKYSEYELNNISWLRSEGQYNAKAIYPAVYDLLLKIYNGTETKAGVSVKLSTETFTDYDFVLNTTDETFRLPIKVKQKFYNAISGNFPVVGNGKALGLTNGSTVSGLSYIQDAGNHGFVPASNCYGVSLPYNGSAQVELYNDGMAIGVTTDSSKSGLIAKLSSSEVSGLYLYFYVGETVQNANLINAGRIEEKVASLIPDNASLISEYGMSSGEWVSLTPAAAGTWYTAPANGIVRAWGYINTSQSTYINIYTNKGGAVGCYVPQNWGAPNLSIRVAKGEKFQVTDYNNISDARLSFYYLKSEV